MAKDRLTDPQEADRSAQIGFGAVVDAIKGLTNVVHVVSSKLDVAIQLLGFLAQDKAEKAHAQQEEFEVGPDAECPKCECIKIRIPEERTHLRVCSNCHHAWQSELAELQVSDLQETDEG